MRIKAQLASLALQLKSNATQSVLTVARIADQTRHPWPADLLETVLHELEHLVLTPGGAPAPKCALLQDVSRPPSARQLLAACCSAEPIEQQTAVRLLLLAGRHAPHLYQQSVAVLLGRGGGDSAASSAHLGALVRLLAPPLGTTPPAHVQTAIERALDGILMHHDRSTAAERGADRNVLGNLLRLVRLGRQTTAARNGAATPTSAAEAAGQEVARCVATAVAKLLEIWSLYLQREMRYIEAAEVELEPVVRVKRMRLAADVDGATEEEASEDDEDEEGETNGDRCALLAEKIHACAQLLDVLECGGAESKLSEYTGELLHIDFLDASDASSFFHQNAVGFI